MKQMQRLPSLSEDMMGVKNVARRVTAWHDKTLQKKIAVKCIGEIILQIKIAVCFFPFTPALTQETVGKNDGWRAKGKTSGTAF